MSLLYDVYQHPSKGAWGVSVSGQSVSTVEIAAERLKESTLQAHKLAGEISKRVRLGYVKAARAKYLKVIRDDEGKLNGSFVDRHPELLNDAGVVLFTTRSNGDDMAALTQQWEVLLEKTDVRPEAIDAWLKQAQRASEYIVATATHPAFALVLADWAIGQRRLLMGTQGDIPDGKPMQSPLEWGEWLNKTFDDKSLVRGAMEKLGWSVKDAIMRADTAITQNEDVADGWSANVTCAF